MPTNNSNPFVEYVEFIKNNIVSPTSLAIAFDIEFKIKKVIFNPPATIVFWEDGTKTVVKTGPNDIFDPEKGLAMAISKRALGNKGNYYDTFKEFLPIDYIPTNKE